MTETFYPDQFDQLRREFFAEKPSHVDGQANKSALYWKRWMLSKIFGRFDIGGLPDNWDRDYFLSHLFIDGVICVTDTALGVIPLKTGYAGINVYDHPTECIIANAVLGNFRKKIGTECVLIKLQYNYLGVGQLIDRYAYLLAACDSGIATNLMNCKATLVGHAKTKSQAETMKTMYTEISQGKPLVIGDFSGRSREESGHWEFFPVKNAYIADQIDELKQFIKNEFLSEIGIATANSRKRERMITDEITAENELSEYAPQHWLDNIREGFAEVKRLYGIDLTIKLRELSEGGVTDGQTVEYAPTAADSV